MSLLMRILLFCGAVGTLVYFFRKIRKNRLDIEYAIFWVLFSAVLTIVSVFPGVITWSAGMLGFVSPANMVFLVVIFMLIIKLFSMTLKISMLEEKLRKLTQHIAIEEANSSGN